jgi:hypothetical protein
MNKRQSTAAAPVPPPAAGTHQLVADPLAVMATKAASAFVVGALVVAGAVAGAVYAETPLPLAAVVLAVPALVYGVALWLNLGAERRRFYAAEVRDQRDYNRDGVVGDPSGHVVTVAGAPAFVLPDLHPDTPAGPPPALIHFPCTANDVLWILDRAAQVGLGFRQWEGQRLPSKIKIDRATWGAVQDGLLRWQFATSRNTATGRRVDLRIDIGVEAMKDAVRKGAGEP